MTIKNGRVETPDTIIDENGVRRKIPRMPNIAPVTPPTPDQWKYMTPEQRRQLRILLRNQKLRGVPVPAPTP
jgi:hypothetical protein